MLFENFTDIDLLLKLKESQQRAFEEIYNRHWLSLFTIAYNIVGVKEESEELVQDLFETIWLKRKDLKIEHLGMYLAVSIKHKSFNMLKSKINFGKFQEYKILTEIILNHSTDDIVNYNTLSDALEKALQNLPEKSSAIFKKSRFENMPVKKIASDLNLTEKAVEYHITKSLKVLQEELKIYNSVN